MNSFADFAQIGPSQPIRIFRLAARQTAGRQPNVSKTAYQKLVRCQPDGWELIYAKTLHKNLPKNSFVLAATLA